MPTQKKSKKKNPDNSKQKSLFSFVDDTKTKKEKIENKVRKEVAVKKIVEKQEKTDQDKVSIKTVPESLFFKGNNKPFGLKEGNIELEPVKRESVTSKYIRYLVKKGEIVQDLERGLLLDVDYDGGQNKAFCKFYDLDTDEIRLWIDTTNHQPYCLSKDSIADLEKNIKLTNYDGFARMEEVKRFDLLGDKELKMTKIYGKTPINIGGSGNNIKNILEGAWEADIRYHLNYIFDRQLIPGLIYSIENGVIKKESFDESNEDLRSVANDLLALFKNEAPEIQEFSEKYLDIFLTPIPDVKRLALDIEVNVGEHDYQIPDPRLAQQEIISISFVSTEGLKLVYMLERDGYTYNKPHERFPSEAKTIYFKSEKELLTEAFRIIWEYPVIITFNGDNFDLNYMFHRANKDKIRIDRDLNPIHVKRGFGILSKAECDLRKGIHIDIFNFFFNRSISGYAFGGAYERNSLNAISAALLGKKKYHHEEEIQNMEYNILAWYNLKDSLLTLELTAFNNSLVWNLIILLCRITKMPIHEMVRRQISTWIQNLFYYEHRRKGFLIPRRSEISELKKGGYSRSTIEGKGFKGAYVITPIPGIHYDVVVMDFSSLYPSIIKEYNLSYETVQCPHGDCEDNLLQGTPYYRCTHKMGIFAYVVGFFRDIRVKYFKPKSTDKNLSEKQRSYYNTIQQALKVFINGSYGVFGSKNFPLFCLPVAESTTGIGQYSIKSTIKKSEEFGVKVLYGDTDSVFLLNPSKAQMDEISKWSREELDLDLEEEKTYQFLALSKRKKNYIGIYKGSGYVEMKGLVAKKRNTAEFVKKVFSELIESLKKITNDDEFLKARNNIIEIIKSNLKKIGKPNTFTLEDYAINIGMQKKLDSYKKTIPQHVRAALDLKKTTGKEYQKGDIISIVKTKGLIGARAIELVKLQDIDVKKYKQLLQSALEQVLDALGITFEEIKGIKKMDAFF